DQTPGLLPPALGIPRTTPGVRSAFFTTDYASPASFVRRACVAFCCLSPLPQPPGAYNSGNARTPPARVKIRAAHLPTCQQGVVDLELEFVGLLGHGVSSLADAAGLSLDCADGPQGRAHVLDLRVDSVPLGQRLLRARAVAPGC